MKSVLQPLRYQVASLALLALGLAAQPSHAAAPARQTVPAPTPTGLRVIITPLANSPVLRVRYESPQYGSVRLELRDTQGRVLYSEVQRRARFAGDFDLAAYPAGNYTLALATPTDRYTQTVRLTRPTAGAVATLVAPAAEAAPLGLLTPSH